MTKEKLKALLIRSDTTIKQAMQKLSETSERILFVVDAKDKLLGTVTDGDIRTGLINGLSFGKRVEVIMYRKFIAAEQDESDIGPKIKRLMIENKIGQIPILDRKGIITDVCLWTDVFGEEKHTKPSKLRENVVVIMAGGRGTRLDPFTRILPKPLIPIGNRPVVEMIMEKYYQHGFCNFIYTLNYKKEYMKLFLRESNFPYSIDWVEEGDYLGTAGGLQLLKGKISDTFFVTNCDSVLDIDFEKALEWHKKQKAAMTIIGCHSEVKIQFGVLELSNGRLEKIVEKPVHDVIMNTGVYLMEPHLISYIKRNQRVNMDSLIDMVIAREKATVYPISSGWYDIGQWEEYRKNLEKLGELQRV